MGALSSRRQTDLDPRTFVSDRLDYMNNVIGGAIPLGRLLSEPTRYAVEAGGKRLRPALTLMLAESLGVPYGHIEPLLQTSELLHTSSLLFDDLPAQDNAQQRRGKPTTHRVFGEWQAQLAGISAISAGFGALAGSSEHFSAEKVSQVLRYTSTIMGMEGLCDGQAMDLSMEGAAIPITFDNIFDMYHRKTSLAIEAALVPVMMLLDKSDEEINLIKDFARNAGIVFQVRDDILDVTASVLDIGKDTQADKGKVNIAQLYDVKFAEQYILQHVEEALRACRLLPFNSDLLQATVRHFATRKK
jgi:geranylgeranyl pyrophosphate synthase